MIQDSNSHTWRKSKLKDLCDEITVGHVGPMAQEYVPDGVPFLRSQNIQPFRLDLNGVKFIAPAFHQRLRKSALKPGDVVVVRTGNPGTACVIPEMLQECNCADLVIFRPSRDLDPWFLAALLNSAGGKSQIAGSLVGVAQQHFNVSAAKDLLVKVPPLPTQRKIADILSAYDDLIENNTRRIKLLEEMAQTIYREWFVHFRFPGHEDVEMVETELGLAPEGWTIRKLQDLVETQYGYTETATEIARGPKFVRGMDINKTSFIEWDRVPYCVITDELLPRYKTKMGDILVIRMADPGKVGIIKQEIDAVFASYLIRLQIRSNDISPYYLFYFLTSDRYQDYVSGASTGTTRKSASAGVMVDIDLLIPYRELRQRYEDEVSVLRQMLNNLVTRNANLRRTRDLLLPKLVSGEVELGALALSEVGSDS